MNIYQRIIFVIGAIILVIALWATPQYITIQGHTIKYDSSNKKLSLYYPKRDMSQIIFRATGIIGVTILLFFAFKGLNSNKP